MSEVSKTYNKIYCYVTLFVFIICCIINKNIVTSFEAHNYYEVFKYALSCFGTSFFFSTIFMCIFDKHLWRIKIINRIISKTPILSSEYKGTIKYDYNGKSSTKNITFHITQTYRKCKIETNTDQNDSVSIVSSIINNYGQDTLFYTYVSTPHANDVDNRGMYYGTAILRILSNELSGNYYTDRETFGYISVHSS